ncbi:MAG: ABC transporter ATP-binding protein [Anaerolineae bacterium]
MTHRKGATTSPAVVVAGVTKSFGDFEAIRDLSLHLNPGEILALLGPNGAGKTTTVRLIASLLTPTQGSIQVFGYDTVRQATQVRSAVGLLTEAPGLYGRMRAPAYLTFFGRLHGMPSPGLETAVAGWLRRLGLWEARNLRLGEYSKGMRQKLALIRALLHQPPLILLDEPTSALDPAWAHQVHQIIRELRDRGHSIVVCTHNLSEAQSLADRVAVMDAGRLVLTAPVPELQAASGKRKLMELRMAAPPEGALDLVGRLVEVQSVGDGWVRFWTNAPEQTNPLLLQRLTTEGIAVVTLSEVQRTLEDIYLELMEPACRQGAPT